MQAESRNDPIGSKSHSLQALKLTAVSESNPEGILTAMFGRPFRAIYENMSHSGGEKNMNLETMVDTRFNNSKMKGFDNQL